MVQDIEQLSTKLQVDALIELPHFRQREVPIPEVRSPENIATGVTESARSGGREDLTGITDGFTPSFPFILIFNCLGMINGVFCACAWSACLRTVLKVCCMVIES